jgi:heme/copper-type cytochrome/quinol oxidase subunit 2
VNKWNNEHGATLVIAVMVITIILLFILTLSYQITNTNNQVSKAERIAVAEQIATMGVEYYNAYAKEKVEIVFEENNEVKLPNIQLEEKFILDDNGNYLFWIKSHSLRKDSDSELVINFTSVGEANGEIREIDSSIIVNIVESGE